MKSPKPWMKTKPDKVSSPTYDDLVRVLGELIAACHYRRMCGRELTHAEHIHNRAMVAKPPRRATLPALRGQGRLV